MITHEKILALGDDFAADSGYQLYALADHAGIPGLCAQLARTQTPWRSLFQGSNNEGALEVAPILFPITVGERSFRQDALLKWICNNGAYSSCLIFMLSPLCMDNLSQRLLLRIDAELPERMDIVLRYFDARIFESLLTVLTDEQKRAFLGPAHCWWFVNRTGDLQHVDSSLLANEEPYIPLVFDVSQEAALLDASEPDQVAQLLHTFVPSEFGELVAGQGYDFIVKHMQAARVFGVRSTHDHALYCALALLNGDDFSEQPKWSSALQDVGLGRLSLTDAVERAETNDQGIS